MTLDGNLIKLDSKRFKSIDIGIDANLFNYPTSPFTSLDRVSNLGMESAAL